MGSLGGEILLLYSIARIAIYIVCEHYAYVLIMLRIRHEGCVREAMS